ncbi:hypothetical protein T484DRAFT_1806480 [Baffinella frigidus]|nr:hypothetical protein T484DRAFT_1806480 [Cryptophyta sp. CCMP2293]
MWLSNAATGKSADSKERGGREGGQGSGATNPEGGEGDVSISSRSTLHRGNGDGAEAGRGRGGVSPRHAAGASPKTPSTPLTPGTAPVKREHRGGLGLMLERTTVAKVVPASPCALAGIQAVDIVLKVGDVVLKVNGSVGDVVLKVNGSVATKENVLLLLRESWGSKGFPTQRSPPPPKILMPGGGGGGAAAGGEGGWGRGEEGRASNRRSGGWKSSVTVEDVLAVNEQPNGYSGVAC